MNGLTINKKIRKALFYLRKLYLFGELINFLNDAFMLKINKANSIIIIFFTSKIDCIMNTFIETWIQEYPEAYSMELLLDETVLFFNMLCFPLVGDQNKNSKEDQ